MLRTLPTVLWVATLAACAGPTGPIFGDWRGSDTTGWSYDLPEIEIILDGPPNATGGAFHLVRMSHDLFFTSVPFPSWDGRWTSESVTDSGRPLTLVHLEGLPYGHIEDYALLANGLLVPVANRSHPDLSEASRRYALAPVPRTAFGYGRP